MCGFIGFTGGGDSQLDKGVLQSMTDAIAHRGPDDADYYMDGLVSLGFRRLSIIGGGAAASFQRGRQQGAGL